MGDVGATGIVGTGTRGVEVGQLGIAVAAGQLGTHVGAGIPGRLGIGVGIGIGMGIGTGMLGAGAGWITGAVVVKPGKEGTGAQGAGSEACAVPAVPSMRVAARPAVPVRIPIVVRVRTLAPSVPARRFLTSRDATKNQLTKPDVPWEAQRVPNSPSTFGTFVPWHQRTREAAAATLADDR